MCCVTGRPGLCIGTLGPGVANISGAMMCALVENSPVIFLGGQRARITERRVRRGRIQFVQQEGLFTPSVKYSSSIEYADQTDEIVREAIRRAMSGTPGPSYIEFPSHVILEELDVPDPLPPSSYRLVNQSAGASEVAAAARLIREAKSPILLVGHGVHTSRTGPAVKELAELMACPVIQTSGGTSFIPGLQDRTFPYLFSPAANEAVEESDLCVALGTELGEPMVSSSLILPGETEPRALGWEIKEELDHAVDLVVEAGETLAEPTTVVDWSEGYPEVVRLGAGDVRRFEE